jgi:integrase
MVQPIQSVSGRSKLKPRREPYWQRVKKGVFVGYRKMSAETPGTWVARVRLPNGKQAYKPLGPLEQVVPHDRFDKAVDAAASWSVHAGAAAESSEVRTVGHACAAYADHLRETKGGNVAADAEARYRRWVTPHKIWSVGLADLTRDHCREFRRYLSAAPVQRTPNGARPERDRSKATVNRDLTPLRAALNHALAEGNISSDLAWRETLKPFKNADRRRELYLDRDQRQALIKHAESELGLFLRGLANLPLRPGALAALRVSDFEARLGTLRIGKDKHGQDRKLPVGPRLSELLSQIAQGKNPDEAIFTRANGRPWDKDAWKDPIKTAAAAAGLPQTTTAYTLRHSVITDLVHGGLDLLTAAQISGTSVAMIERHYGHLRGSIAAAALERLSATE